MSDKDFEGLEKLENSIEYMISSDWKKRFIAEYAQLITRLDRLLISIWDTEEGYSIFDCPAGLLEMQVEAMRKYVEILEIRAELYGIDLEKEVEKLNR